MRVYEDLPILKNQVPYSILEDVRTKKADITIRQLVAMVSSARKELRSSLTTYKVPYISHSLNTIGVQQKYDPIIDVGCNGSTLRSVLVDVGASVNVMTIPLTRSIGLAIERPSSII